MKKFLGILVMAGALVACNDSAETTVTEDTTTIVTPPPPMVDTTTVDTTNLSVDTTTRVQP